MQYLIIFFLCLHGATAFAAPKCSTIFRGERPGYTLSGKPLRLPPAFEISYQGRSSGHIRLQELIREGKIHSHPDIATGTLSAIRSSSSGVELGSKDSVLMLDVMGDTGGQLFKRLVEGMIHSKTLDVLGVEAHTINYRSLKAESEGKALAGTPRVIIVIKEGLRDYRELPEGEGPIVNRRDAVDWLGREITSMFDSLFDASVFRASENPETMAKIYQFMAQRPGIPEGHPRHKMSPNEFNDAFNVGFDILLKNINTLDLLYLRPTFWDARPVADPMAVELFHFANQRGQGSVDQFVEGFSAQALKLRERLYRHIHRNSGSGRSGSGNDYSAAETLASTGRMGGRGQESTELSGITPQGRFGLDFFSSRGGEFQSVREAMEYSSPQVREIAERLELAGITEVVQLQRIDATKLELEAPHLTIYQIQALALELSHQGVYMTYPSSLYFRMDPQIRRIVSPPRHRNFEYNPRSNTYSPRRFDNEEN